MIEDYDDALPSPKDKFEFLVCLRSAHIESYISSVLDNFNINSCPFENCNIVDYRNYELHQHIQRSHYDIGIYECPKCQSQN